MLNAHIPRRSSSPISNEAVVAISEKFSAPALLAHVARARKEATGSMFPRHIPS